MAINAWTGTIDTDWENNGNWSLGYYPAAAHLADEILYDHRAVRNCTTNVDRSADGTYTGGLNVTSGMNYNVGASGAPLIIDMDATVRMHGNGDEFWFDSNGELVPEFVAAPKKHTANACQIDAVMTDLTCLSGTIVLNTGASLAGGRMRVMYDPLIGGTPRVTVPSGATVTTATLMVLAGQVTTEAAWPTMLINGGTVYHEDGTITLAYLDGGELREKIGTVTTLWQSGGMLDCKSYAGWTITTAYNQAGIADYLNGAGREPATLKIYPMAEVRRASGVS